MGCSTLDSHDPGMGNRAMTEPQQSDADSGTEDGVRIVQFNATYEGFGMVMDYIGRQLPFATYEAGTLTEALHQQLKFGHNLVALRNNKLVGYAGWLLTTTEIAEGWLVGSARLLRKHGAEAEAGVLTIVAGENSRIVARLIRGTRRLNPGKRAYFKREADNTKSARKRSLPA